MGAFLLEGGGAVSIPREFVPLDTQFYLDERIQRAGSAAEVLYTRGLAFAKGAGSDGIVSRYGLLAFSFGIRNVTDKVRKLVDAGLWIEVDGGWRISNWEKWNKTSAQISEEKEAKKAAAILGNHKRWHVAKGEIDPRCEHCISIAPAIAPAIQESESESDLESESDSESQLLPSYEGRGAKAPRAQNRGTRISPDWTPSRETVQTLASEHPELDTRAEHLKFIDYWQAQPGQKGVKLDWQATWRNWMRKAAEDLARKPQGYQSTAQRMQAIRDEAQRADSKNQLLAQYGNLIESGTNDYK